MLRTSFKQIGIGLGVIVFGWSLALLVTFAASYAEPTAAPPGGNVPAPLNVGTDLQIKSGDLVLLNIAVDNVVATEDSLLSGKVAIGGDEGDVFDVANFPTEALEVWGEIAMKGGTLVDNEITGVDWPTASSSAATKGYVDAAGGGGGAGGTTVMTLWGTSLGVGPDGTNPVSPGAGTLVCEAFNGIGVGGGETLADFGKWVELYSGYGPHHSIYKSQEYENVSTSPPFSTEITGPLAPGDSVDTEYVSISGSTCSQQRIQSAGSRPLIAGSLPPGVAATIAVDACSEELCNTCRVCQFLWDPPTP